MSHQRNVTDPFDQRYQETVFLLDVPLPNHWSHFCVITACNPEGTLSLNCENEEYTQALRRYLLQRELSFYSVLGSASDMTHQEMGFGVQLGIREAKALAQTFKQLAFYLVENDELFLVDSESLDTKSLGSWRERVVVL